MLGPPFHPNIGTFGAVLVFEHKAGRQSQFWTFGNRFNRSEKRILGVSGQDELFITQRALVRRNRKFGNDLFIPASVHDPEILEFLEQWQRLKPLDGLSSISVTKGEFS